MQERFQEFTVLISSINRCIYRIKSEEMQDFNLKSSHVNCLYYIYKQKNLTAKVLCDLCGDDKANISRALKFLENNGFIVCNSKTLKRYQSPLELTSKGSEVAKSICDKIDNVLAISSLGMSEENRKIMYECLNIINDNLKKKCDSYQKENNK